MIDCRGFMPSELMLILQDLAFIRRHSATELSMEMGASRLEGKAVQTNEQTLFP